MGFRIPFTISSIDKLRKRSAIFKKWIKYKKESQLKFYLENADLPLSREEYLAICIRGFVFTTAIFFVLLTTVFYIAGFGVALALSGGISILIGGFVYLSQSNFPKLYSNRRQKKIERNLISALQDILVQLNSGVPLFSILINISSSDYGVLSEEFKKIVKKINAGRPQIDVLEEVGERNPSIYFRRTLWQMSNGMRAGSDLSIVIKDSIRSLEEEQLIQIQNYGNKLNPMIMFYMLVAVILPALAVTFLTILSSMINLPPDLTMMMFGGLFAFDAFVQIMFLGVIRSLRPSLL